MFPEKRSNKKAGILLASISMTALFFKCLKPVIKGTERPAEMTRGHETNFQLHMHATLLDIFQEVASFMLSCLFSHRRTLSGRTRLYKRSSHESFGVSTKRVFFTILSPGVSLYTKCSCNFSLEKDTHTRTTKRGRELKTRE